jgi:hypothetical protein
VHERIAELAKRIAQMEGERASLAERMRTAAAPEGCLEASLINPLREAPLNCTVAGVDGGLLAQELHGCSLVITRAVAAVFEYKNSRIASHHYHPAASPEPVAEAAQPLDTHEFSWLKSLMRLRAEVRVAVETVERFAPDYLLLDGSVMPHVSDKPPKDSEVRGAYDAVIADFGALYSLCERGRCALLGVIKDSRGRRFVEMLHSGALAGSSDTSFLHYLLKQGERTCAFRCGGAEHPILKDLQRSDISTFYLKPAEHDRPLRVDFLDAGAGYDGIASLVYSLSCLNKRYAYPAVLIEADLRAALEHDVMERTYRSLCSRLGMRGALFRLRRDSRPFR